MLVVPRGGIPHADDLTVTSGGITGWASGYNFVERSRHLQVSNGGGSNLRLYFTLADYTADTHFIELPATTGFFEGPVEASTIWLRSVGGSLAVEICYYTGDVV